MATRMTQGNEHDITNAVTKGVKKLGEQLSKEDKEHLQGYIEKLNAGGISKGFWKGPAVQVNDHTEFVQHVVGDRDKEDSSHFFKQFVDHVMHEEQVTREQAEALVNKVIKHSREEHLANKEEIKGQEQRLSNAIEDHSSTIQGYQREFENNIGQRLDSMQEQFEGLSANQLREAKDNAMVKALMENKEKLDNTKEDNRGELLARLVDKRVNEEVRVMKDQERLNKIEGRERGKFLKALGGVASGIGGIVRKNVGRGYSREYTPTFNKIGRSVYDGAKTVRDHFSNGFLDIVMVIGILLHVVQWITGGWQAPSSVAAKWTFILIVFMSVVVLGAPNSLSLRMRTIGMIAIFFLIEWQWFRVISLLGIGAEWWAFKGLWPSVVIYWTFKAIANEGKKPILTWVCVTMIVGFWVILGYNAIGVSGYIEQFTPEGLSDQQYTDQKTGLLLTLADKVGFDVGEYEYQAAERCKEQYPADYFIHKGRVKFLTRFVSQEFINCMETNIVEIAEEEEIRNEVERVNAAREQFSSEDFTKIEVIEGKPKIVSEKINNDGEIKVAYETSEVIYNVKFDSSKKDVSGIFLAFLNPANLKEDEQAEAAVVECLTIECESVDGAMKIPEDKMGSLRTGVDVRVKDKKLVDQESAFRKGKNVVEFGASFYNLKTKTRLPLIFGVEETIREMEESVKKDKNKEGKKGYTFDYWREIEEENDLLISVKATYPNKKIEGVFSEHPAMIDIKPLNLGGPIIPVSDNRITWKMDVFNSEKKEYEDGRINSIRGVTVFFPVGITPVEGLCDFEKNPSIEIKVADKVIRNAYSLKEEHLKVLDEVKTLERLSDIKDKGTTGIPECVTTVSQEELFGFSSTEGRSHKEEFINQEISVEMEYDYIIVKETEVRIDFEVNREDQAGAVITEPVQSEGVE
jgi:hypothetical protein